MLVLVLCFFRDAESLSGEIDLIRDDNNTAVHGWLSTDNSLYLINAPQFLLVIQEVSGNDHRSAAIIHLGSFDCIESTASLVQAAVDLCIYTCRVVLLLPSSAKPTVLSIIYRHLFVIFCASWFNTYGDSDIILCHFVCQLVFAAILWVKLIETFLLCCHWNTLCT